MPTQRFYCPLDDLAENSRITLPDNVSHHALRVLRLKPGTPIQLFNGQGGYFDATLQVDGKKGLAQVGRHSAQEAELPGEITLVQGIASGDKMDWIIEKAVELGVTHFVPVAAQRSVLQLGGERLGKRMAHWTRVIQSASEQCGRNRLMTLAEPTTLAGYLEQYACCKGIRLLCHPQAAHTLAEALAGEPNALILFVGPEGGWSDDEQACAQQHHLMPVQFGQRVLRTETAGLALVAACSAILGWQ
jgi:16S rRNA (uracil1498-N3)-methyltransferase